MYNVKKKRLQRQKVKKNPEFEREAAFPPFCLDKLTVIKQSGRQSSQEFAQSQTDLSAGFNEHWSRDALHDDDEDDDEHDDDDDNAINGEAEYVDDLQLWRKFTGR